MQTGEIEIGLLYFMERPRVPDLRNSRALSMLGLSQKGCNVYCWVDRSIDPLWKLVQLEMWQWWTVSENCSVVIQKLSCGEAVQHRRSP